MTTFLLALIACAPDAPPVDDEAALGWRRAADVPTQPCLIEDEWPSMGVTVDDLDEDGLLDLAWAECDTLAVRLGHGVPGSFTARVTLDDNPAMAVYSVPNPYTPRGRLIVWLGQRRIEVIRWSADGVYVIPGALGLTHSGDELAAHVSFFDADADGVMELFLGRTTLEGPRRPGAADHGLLAPPTVFHWREERWQQLVEYTDARFGIWHASPVPDDPTTLLVAVDESEVSWLEVSAQRAETVPVADGASPMGSALTWSSTLGTWDVVGSGLRKLHRLRATDDGWFDVAGATGLHDVYAPDVTWTVLPVDGDGDGREEVIVHSALTRTFDEHFGDDLVRTNTDVHLGLSDDATWEITGQLDPTLDAQVMGAVVVDVNGDRRPDIVQRTVRSADGALPILTHQANAGASWAELRFPSPLEAFNATIELALADRIERRVFHPYAQGAGFGNAPLDRTWVPVPGGVDVGVAVTLPDGRRWEARVAAGDTVVVDP